MMSERENRKDKILTAAADLFIQQGYAGTSTQQIADAVGCTKAALYYHFKEGKEELYQEVFKSHSPNLSHMLVDCEAAASLTELFQCFADNMIKDMPERIARIRWVIAEFPNLSESQREMVRTKKQWLVDNLASLINKFLEDRAEADRVATLMLGAIIGYDQLFVLMEKESMDGKKIEDYMQFFSELITEKYTK